MPADYQKKIEDASTLDELFTLWRGKEPESFEYTIPTAREAFR